MPVPNIALAENALLIGAGLGGNKWRSVALGQDATAYTDDDIHLGHELDNGFGGGRKPSANVTKTLETTNFTNDTMRFVANWSFSGSEQINEIAIFNDDAPDTNDNNDPTTGPTSGELGLREVFDDPLFIISADALELTIDVVVDDKTIDEVGQPSQVITQAGMTEMLKLLLEGQTGTRFDHIAFDSVNTAASATNTALNSEITTNGLSRAVATVTQETEYVTGDTTQFEKLFNVTGNQAVNGTGVFNAATSGDLLPHFIYENPLNLINTDNYTQIIRIVHVNS